MDATSPLIDPASLYEYASAPPVVLDVRWTLAGPDRAAFAAGHVPGAVFVDLDADLTAPPGIGGRHPLPEPAVLQRLFERAGIQDGTPVVVCGQADSSSAARAWWLLRWAGHRDVHLLDGGFDAWQRAGLPAETGDGSEPGGGTAVVHSGAMPTVDADRVAAADAVLLDARAAERYRGEVEPVDPVAGHIPGAVNVPLADIHRPDGRLLPAAELRARFAAAGVTGGTPVVASCGSGVTACSLILAGAVAGYEFALYPGSYSGWCALGREVAQG